MTQDEVVARIEPIIRDLFDDYDGPVTASLTADDIEAWDSLSNVQLMVMVERAFGIRLATTDVGAIENLGALADRVIKRATKRGGLKAQ